MRGEAFHTEPQKFIGCSLQGQPSARNEKKTQLNNLFYVKHEQAHKKMKSKKIIFTTFVSHSVLYLQFCRIYFLLKIGIICTRRLGSTSGQGCNLGGKLRPANLKGHQDLGAYLLMTILENYEQRLLTLFTFLLFENINF